MNQIDENQSESNRLALLRQAFPEAFQGKEFNAEKFTALLEKTLDTILSEEEASPLLTWVGKSKAQRLLETPFQGTLVPVEPYGQGFSHLFIQGESLEVLKMLRLSYAGEVRMVWVDPPSLLRRDYIYPDNPEDQLKSYWQLIQQLEQGILPQDRPEAFSTRLVRWLTMLYSRLYISRELLRNDGLIFAHVNQVGLPYLRTMMDNLFGFSNYLTTIVWQKMPPTASESPFYSGNLEFILAYTKESRQWWSQVVSLSLPESGPYQNPDGDPLGPWTPFPLTAASSSTFFEIIGFGFGENPVTSPSGQQISPPQGGSWLVDLRKLSELSTQGRLYWGPHGDQLPVLKRHLGESHQFLISQTTWTGEETGDLAEARGELLEACQMEVIPGPEQKMRWGVSDERRNPAMGVSFLGLQYVRDPAHPLQGGPDGLAIDTTLGSIAAQN